SGELLGFVRRDPAAAGPSGFLHLELLAPADAGLATLLELAERELGLGEGFFPRVRDEGDDNLWSREELDELLAANLPAEDREAYGERLLGTQGEDYEAVALGLLHRAD